MGGWICDEGNLDYPKIWIKMAEMNWSEIYWNDALEYLDPYEHVPWAKYSLLVPIKSWGGNPHLMNHTIINVVLRAYRAK